MRRFFFALWPDDTIRAQLLRTALKIECGDGRRIVAANLHVTLLFIGNVEDGSVEGIGEAADSVIGDRFALHFDTLDRRRGGIAWLAPKVIPPGLSKLVEQLRRRTT
ncbi:MAG TPA: 2'-5' RNA ligase family protein, partial [Gammaproteobacteria bacterium]|nr:2'-5' RNA ligase family protein [Gammaproteobacteria bacterium]